MEVIVSIPTESFEDTTLWKNNKIATQARKRKALSSAFKDLIDPITYLPSAQPTAIEIFRRAKFYDLLSEYLENNPEYHRLLLYFPFEFIPEKISIGNATIKKAEQRFRDIYFSIWKSLLSFYDVRANFIDGDILEGEKKLERVVKAAHFIPILIRKGLLDQKELKKIRDTNDDILKKSITDIIRSSRTETIIRKNIFSLDDIKENLSLNILSINLNEFKPATEKRLKWLQEKNRQNYIIKAGRRICELSKDKDIVADLASSLYTYETSAIKEAVMEGIREMIEDAAKTSLSQAKMIFRNFEQYLLPIKDDENLNRNLIKLLNRLYRLKVITKEQVEDFNVIIPNLSGSFLKNIQDNFDERLFKNILSDFERHGLLNYILPIIIVFGSRLKGYGNSKSDTDVGIFVRTMVNLDERPEIRNSIKEIISDNGLNGEVMDFWLNDYGISDYIDEVPVTGRSYWTNILFNSAWIGEKIVIKEMYSRILTKYFSDDKKILGLLARNRFLEYMEHDLLQYRLMHSGYDNFFPPFTNYDQTPKGTDTNSAFWSPGYRGLATELFLNKVFLPKL